MDRGALCHGSDDSENEFKVELVQVDFFSSLRVGIGRVLL